jgi:hypothetical protein
MSGLPGQSHEECLERLRALAVSTVGVHKINL